LIENSFKRMETGVNIRKIAGPACFLLALAFFAVGVKNTFFNPEIAVHDASGLGVSRLVGSFLPAILVGAIAAKLLQKPKQ